MTLYPRAPFRQWTWAMILLSPATSACELGRVRPYAPPRSAVTVAPRGVLVTSAEAPAPAATAPPGGTLHPIPARDLCVTSGGGAAVSPLRYAVDHPSTRGFVARAAADDVELDFTFHGETPTQLPLASGEMRQAMGLKLRAMDTCNVLYVMWRVAPSPGVYVSVKRNPGMSMHAQCHDGGYRGLAPTSRPSERLAKVPMLTPGSTHALRAAIEGERLRVWTDGALVWSGELPGEARSLRGPAGFRTDDVRVDLELRVPEATLRSPHLACDR
jgi:hypothetical protein